MQNILSSKNTKIFAFFAVLLAFALLQVDFASAAAPTDWVTPVETAVKAEAGNVTKVMLALLVIGLGIFGYSGVFVKRSDFSRLQLTKICRRLMLQVRQGER